METIDQFAVVLSLGVTSVVAVALLIAFASRVHARPEVRAQGIVLYRRAAIGCALAVGTVGLAFLVWLVGASGWRSYHHHFAPFVWFIGFLLNAALGVAYASIGAHLLPRAHAN
jgi:hypothetical protein